MLDKQVKKHLQELQQKKYRKQYGEYIVEGVKGVEEALMHADDVAAVIVDGKRREEKDIAACLTLAEKKQTDIFFAGRNDIDDIKTTETFPGIMAVVAMPDIQFRECFKAPKILCVDGLNDPGNLGTIIRTADWFGISHIILGEGSVDVYNEKVVRSTMGSFFRVKVYTSPSLINSLETLKKEGYSVAAFDVNGTPFTKELILPKKTVLLFGSESHGIRADVLALSNTTHRIVGYGKAESLNVGIAVGISLFACS